MQTAPTGRMAGHFALITFCTTVKSRGAQKQIQREACTGYILWWCLYCTRAESVLHISLSELWLRCLVQESALPLDGTCNPVHAWRFNRANTVFQVTGCSFVLCVLSKATYISHDHITAGFCFAKSHNSLAPLAFTCECICTSLADSERFLS